MVRQSALSFSLMEIWSRVEAIASGAVKAIRIERYIRFGTVSSMRFNQSMFILLNAISAFSAGNGWRLLRTNARAAAVHKMSSSGTGGFMDGLDCNDTLAHRITESTSSVTDERSRLRAVICSTGMMASFQKK